MKFLISLGICLSSVAVKADQPLAVWIQLQTKISTDRMMQNISSAGTVPGTVIASPSKNSPNYYFHWIRDASLTIDQVVTLFKNSKTVNERQLYLQKIREFIQLSAQQQRVPGVEGLGEPRYLVDGTPDTIPWSRPQSDGTALRALTLMRALKVLDKELEKEFEKVLNSDAALRDEAKQVIHRDLEYVILHWNLPCYDLWEELMGLHFYTQFVQAAALRAGSEFFNGSEDVHFSNELAKSALSINQELAKYWNSEKKIIGASRELKQLPNSNYKASNLDTAVILAALHSHSLSFLGFSRDQFLSTALALENVFNETYAVNFLTFAPAIGRFSDDVYFGGNPWYMTTAAFAEFYFRVALEIKNAKEIQVNELNLSFLQNSLSQHKGLEPELLLNSGELISIQSAKGQRLLASLQHRGDTFLETLRKYTGSGGEMSEQFDRQAGVPISAPDLTWSYAGFLSAIEARTLFLTSGK
ncbi:MAG: glycoside hydrolase family 15 protein [Bdellovibrionaceae bacterium]|nr:glycoside hydrolase family 15 protein [Bdellovibrio sp.]